MHGPSHRRPDRRRDDPRTDQPKKDAWPHYRPHSSTREGEPHDLLSAAELLGAADDKRQSAAALAVTLRGLTPAAPRRGGPRRGRSEGLLPSRGSPLRERACMRLATRSHRAPLRRDRGRPSRPRRAAGRDWPARRPLARRAAQGVARQGRERHGANDVRGCVRDGHAVPAWMIGSPVRRSRRKPMRRRLRSSQASTCCDRSSACARRASARSPAGMISRTGPRGADR
jgi:hypothetical protein